MLLLIFLTIQNKFFFLEDGAYAPRAILNFRFMENN
jgi:hypothetical protein